MQSCIQIRADFQLPPIESRYYSMGLPRRLQPRGSNEPRNCMNAYMLFCQILVTRAGVVAYIRIKVVFYCIYNEIYKIRKLIGKNEVNSVH